MTFRIWTSSEVPTEHTLRHHTTHPAGRLVGQCKSKGEKKKAARALTTFRQKGKVQKGGREGKCSKSRQGLLELEKHNCGKKSTPGIIQGNYKRTSLTYIKREKKN
ncbi:hypothetical protein ABW19_dt0206258 [Dactylella cylindrospora]|nr:hypothetical protein ABW19_dt0206258 [Dactylella cylindrospora]